ncbi:MULTISPECIES: hypothetical protein [Bacillus cereus group]|uniref:hypothetical protein n=1 Tax=Bacillus cereus group TaxID=86661 RepID=UPI001F55B5C0|nr:hypothetical protein [Bacillus cereus group sp. BfR-BA-01317]
MSFGIHTGLSIKKAGSLEECVSILKGLQVMQAFEVIETGLDVALRILYPGEHLTIEDNKGKEIKVSKLTQKRGRYS